MKEKSLDKATIDAYYDWVQRGIRSDLNSLSLGPGRLPFRVAVGLVLFGFCCLLVGILLVALRMRHVYLWDWDAQFLGPFFVIMFLMCMAGATYLILIAKRKSNKYRTQLYFKPLGDYGVACVHESELARDEEMKHDLKSGTTPHKVVKPRSEAYSMASRSERAEEARRVRAYHDNHAYDKTPDGNKAFRPDDRRRPPHDGRRGPPPDGRRGPPPDGRRGPPPDGRRGPPPDDRRRRPEDQRRGPHGDDRRRPPPDERRRPPDDRRRPPPGDERRRPPPDDEHRRPPPNDDRRRGPHPDDRPRGPHPDDRPRGPPQHRGPPDNDRERIPAGAVRLPVDEGGRRPRGVPKFGAVEVIPDEDRRNVNMILDKSRESESEI